MAESDDDQRDDEREPAPKQGSGVYSLDYRGPDPHEIAKRLGLDMAAGGKRE